MALYKTDENGNLIKIAGFGDTSKFATKDEIPPVYPVVAKYKSSRLQTAGTHTLILSNYINAEDYVEGAVYEVYLQGYLYGVDSHKTTWATDLLPSAMTTFNISGYGRQNGFVGSVVASSEITVTLNNAISGDEYCYVTYTGYRRLY